jgi:hypothetical protein
VAAGGREEGEREVVVEEKRELRRVASYIMTWSSSLC